MDYDPSVPLAPPWTAALSVAAALLLGQALLWLLMRGLGLRIPPRILLLGHALVIVTLAPWLTGDRLLAPMDETIRNNVPGAPIVEDPDRHGLFNDIVLQLLPWEIEVRRAYEAGRLPLWSDLLDGGSSPWVNPQAAVLSPIANLVRWSPIEHSLLAALAVKMLVAFQGTWLLARRLGARRIAASLAAAAFPLSGAIMAWSLFPLSSVVAWTPWAALAAILLFRRPNGRRIAVAGCIFAFLLLSGHPESALAGGIFAGLCGLAYRKRLRHLGSAAAAWALALGLAAPHLLPFLHVLPDTQRAVRTAEASAGEGWFPTGKERLLLAPANPRVYGRPFHEPYRGPLTWSATGAGYAGLVAFAGALAALFSSRRSWPLLGFAAVSFLAAADFLPFHALPQALELNRFLPAAALALILAASLAKPSLLGVGIAAVLSLVLRPDPQVILLWVLILAGFVTLRRWRIAGASLLAAALLFDLLPWSWDMLPKGHRELFYPRTPFVDAAVLEGPWRATAEGFSFYPSLMPVYGGAEVRSHNPMALGSQLAVLERVFRFKPEGRRYKSAFRNVDHPLLDFLNVRTVISKKEIRTNPEALPRIFLPVAARARTRERALDAVANLKNPRRVILLAEEVGDWTPPQRPWEPEAVKVLVWAPGKISVEIPQGGEKLLATSLPFPEGWTVSRGRTVTVNTAYLGVIVPDGVGRVDLAFAPPGFRLGLLLGLGALGASIFLFSRYHFSSRHASRKEIRGPR